MFKLTPLNTLHNISSMLQWLNLCITVDLHTCSCASTLSDAVLTSVTGLIGLILFSLVAKKYKYRTRDEGLFHQQVVEDIYDRYITQAAYMYSGLDHRCSSCED